MAYPFSINSISWSKVCEFRKGLIDGLSDKNKTERWFISQEWDQKMVFRLE